MDKNTITGMLLMGAVIFGFMWLNQPSKEEIERQREAARIEADAAKAKPKHWLRHLSTASPMPMLLL